MSIQDKLNEQGWAVCDKQDLLDYILDYAKQVGTTLAGLIGIGNEEDMASEYACLVELKQYYDKVKGGGDCWRAELNDMADSGVYVEELDRQS